MIIIIVIVIVIVLNLLNSKSIYDTKKRESLNDEEPPLA